MTRLHPIFSPQDISLTVKRLSEEIKRDYQDKSPLLISVLKGSFIFMADLVRNLDMPVELEFVTLSSYGRGRKESSGKVSVVQGLSTPIKDRDIIIVEDIVDTGITLNFFLDYLQSQNPSSVKVCALFNKPSCRKVEVPIHYLGLDVPDAFIVGYGLDWDEKYRHLPGLYSIGGES